MLMLPGEDWIRASVKLLPESPAKESALKLLSLFEHPACQDVKPDILLEEGLDREIFMGMAEILEKPQVCPARHH